MVNSLSCYCCPVPWQLCQDRSFLLDYVTHEREERERVSEREGQRVERGLCSPGIHGDGHIHSERMREWHSEQIVQGARVKQSDHTLSTPTNNIRLTQ